MTIIKNLELNRLKYKSNIEFENVSIAYGNRLILDNINFKVNQNTIHGMLGPNGAGKAQYQFNYWIN